jgi:peptidoglycan-associated lipoprotein
MMRAAMTLCAIALACTGNAASAQLRLPPIIRRAPQPPAPLLQGIDALRADFAARSGANTVYFGINSAQLGMPARVTLSAQAQWLLQHPGTVVRIEGYGDPADTRDHALALGARRAAEVRDNLVLMGVPAAQLSITSWGKERPGSGRAVTILVR